MPRGIITDPPSSAGLLENKRTGALYRFWPKAGETYTFGDLVYYDKQITTTDTDYDQDEPSHRNGRGFARNVRYKK